MPNRMLRDWTGSESVDMVSVHAERFFTRLIMKVDDFGRYSANEKLLNSTLFPLKDDVRDADISRWMAECQKAGLILVYEVESKRFLQINDFNQRLRQKKEKYPPPPDDGKKSAENNDGQMTVICQTHDNQNRIEEKRIEVASPATDPVTEKIFEMFRRITDWSTEKVMQEVGKFRNKYPDLPVNKSGPVVNTWVTNANNGRNSSGPKRMVI